MFNRIKESLARRRYFRELQQAQQAVFDTPAGRKFQTVVDIMQSGPHTPFLMAIKEAQNHEYVDPESDDVVDHLQPSTMVQVEDGRLFYMCEDSAIFMGAGLDKDGSGQVVGSGSWVRREVFETKWRDKIKGVFRIDEYGKLHRVHGESSLPADLEITE